MRQAQGRLNQCDRGSEEIIAYQHYPDLDQLTGPLYFHQSLTGCSRHRKGVASGHAGDSL